MQYINVYMLSVSVVYIYIISTTLTTHLNMPLDHVYHTRRSTETAISNPNNLNIAFQKPQYSYCCPAGYRSIDEVNSQQIHGKFLILQVLRSLLLLLAQLKTIKNPPNPQKGQKIFVVWQPGNTSR